MKPSEAAAVLTACSSLDQRTIGDDEAIVWAKTFTRASIGVTDAVEAVIDFYANPLNVDKRATATGLIVQAKAIRRARMTAAGDPPFPPDLTVAQEMAWRRHWINALERDFDTAQEAADHAMGIARTITTEIRNEPVMRQIRAIAMGKAV